MNPSKLEELPWKEGWGGVIKAELTDVSGKAWTFLKCDDGTYTVYCYHGGEKDFLEDMLSELQVEEILEDIGFVE